MLEMMQLMQFLGCRTLLLSTACIALAWLVLMSEAPTAAADPKYGMFAPAQRISAGGGCPLAALWTAFSNYPSDVNSVGGGEQAPTTRQLGYSSPSNCTPDEYNDISNAFLALWEEGELEAPKANRLAFHSAATYAAGAGPGALGGPNGGWFKFPQNADFKGNAGLADTISILMNFTAAHPCITFADSVFFAAAVLTEAAGGPPIAWIPGRLDALDSTSTISASPPLAARLPDASFTTSAVQYFYTLMGLSSREMVALNGGGHSFGAADLSASGWNGSFTQAADVWPSPKNLYFIQSFNVRWVPQLVSSDNGKRIQYVIAPGQTAKAFTADGSHIIRLPSDIALLTAGGNLTAWARYYAENETLFLEDFARAMQRISQLGAGTSWQVSTEYVWLGLHGNATNYGPTILIQTGNPPGAATNGAP